MKRLLTTLLILSGCQETNLTGIDKYTPPAEDTSQPPEEIGEAEQPEVVEDCPDRIYSAIQLSIDEECKIEPPVHQYTPTIEWSMSDFAEYPSLRESVTAPVVGQLTDDNGDGVVDSNDTPDIVSVMGNLSYLGSPNTDGPLTIIRLISGDGTAVHWTKQKWEWQGEWYEPIAAGTPALGDVDLDGEPEIVVALAPFIDPEISGITDWFFGIGHDGVTECVVAVLNTNGELEQMNTTDKIQCYAHSPAIADVDSDGQPDIVVEKRTFQGNDLQLLTIFEDTPLRGMSRSQIYWTGGISVVSDLDGDGLMEFVSGRHIQEYDGTLRCLTGDTDGFTAVADLNMDGYGEIVVTGHSNVVVYDRNCTMINAWPNEDGGRGGPPTIADYDGDGVPEIGFPSKTVYSVYEADGTLKWTSPATDLSSNCTGSSVFDFEEDGYAEVVYADEANLWIISGHNGGFVMREPYHTSGTANEYPVVVDVDGDNEAEIVVHHDQGVYVVSALEGWAPTRQVWNQHGYNITNINDDLSIPSPTLPNWPEYNSYRSNDLRENNGQGALLVDAIPLEVDICEVECDRGTVRVVLSVGNQGLADAVSGIDFALYTEIEGARQLLDSYPAQYPVRTGYSSEGFVFDLDITEIPEGNIIISVDDDGTGIGRIDECNESNNEIRFDNLCGSEE